MYNLGAETWLKMRIYSSDRRKPNNIGTGFQTLLLSLKICPLSMHNLYDEKGIFFE